jgi:argininosuccinate lyase
MGIYAVSQITPAENVLNDPRYRYIFSVEEVNKLVLQGMPFRDAYKTVAKQISEGTYNPSQTVIHTHEGSIGNLCNDKISLKFENIWNEFDFESKENAYRKLLKR